MARVTVVQPYLPAYRVPLFQQVSARLRERGHELTIVAGIPTGDQAARADLGSMTELRRSSTTRSPGFGPIRGRLIARPDDLRDADALVVGLAAGSLDTIRALTGPRRVPVAVWGHVGDYVMPGSVAGRVVKRWQVRTANRVFAYTPSGARQAVRWGADPAHVDTLNNTVDLAALSRAMATTSAIEPAALRHRLGSPDHPTFAFIGGLDDSKRVDLLADALQILHDQGETVHVLAAGEGADAALLAPAIARGQVTMMGRAGDDCKALMASASVALLNPGRVGLIAAESFVLGLPILTTTGARHAPEFDYLEIGVDSDIVTGDAAAYARAVRLMIHEPDRTAAMHRAALRKAGRPSLAAMADTFVSGVESLLDTRMPPSRR